MSQLAVRSQTTVRGHANALRYALGGLLAFGALNAFAGGYYGMAGAEKAVATLAVRWRWTSLVRTST